MPLDATSILPALQLAWSYWPFLPLLALAALLLRSDRSRPLARLVWALFMLWNVWVLLRMVLLVASQPPLQTPLELLFWGSGAVLAPLAVVLALKQRRRESQQILPNHDLLVLQSMEAADFEELVIGVYQAFDRRVVLSKKRGKYKPDLFLYPRNGQKWIVQCKPGKQVVDLKEVRGFYRTMGKVDVPRGAIVSAGQFSREAQEWAADKPLHLYSGDDLLHAIRRARALRQARQDRAAAGDWFGPNPARLPGQGMPEPVLDEAGIIYLSSY
jgi:hypothetical protein